MINKELKEVEEKFKALFERQKNCFIKQGIPLSQFIEFVPFAEVEK